MYQGRRKVWTSGGVGGAPPPSVEIGLTDLPCHGTTGTPSPGLSSLGVPGVPWHTQILADYLTLFQPGGTDYAHLITTGTPGFSDLPTAVAQGRHLNSCKKTKLEISFEIDIEI